MNFSPKLKRVMEEIKTILNENDIAGLVVLHEPGYSEYLLKINPSYSCVKFGANGELRVKNTDMGYSEEKKKELAENTCNMLTLLSDTTGPLALGLIELAEKVENAIDVEHTQGKHTPDINFKN